MATDKTSVGRPPIKAKKKRWFDRHKKCQVSHAVDVARSEVERLADEAKKAAKAIDELQVVETMQAMTV